MYGVKHTIPYLSLLSYKTIFTFLQNKAIRIINDVPLRSNVNNLYDKHDIISVKRLTKLDYLSSSIQMVYSLISWIQ